MVRQYWNSPPGWPKPPAGWLPPVGWIPPDDWPEPPPGWVFVIEVDDAAPGPPPAWVPHPAAARRRSRAWPWALASMVAALTLLAGAVVGFGLDEGRLRSTVSVLGVGPQSSPPAPAAAAQVEPPQSRTPEGAPASPVPAAPTEPAPAISVQPMPTPTVATRTQTPEPAPPPDFPPAGVGEQPRRLLPAVPYNGNPTWSAMTTNPNGSPAGFSPCRPWQIVVNLAGAPPGAYEVVAEAVATVSQATGVVFVLEGPTDEPVSAQETRRAYQPERYGQRWAPILIGWAPSTEENAAGQGGPQGVTMSDSGMTHYVTGFVAIDPQGTSSQDPITLRAILLHELAHVVGLNHVADPKQLMAPVYQGQREFQVGDLAGLAAVGTASCSPDL